MNNRAVVLVSVALLGMVSVLLWPRLRSSSHSIIPYTMTMRLSGTPGATFSGEYMRNGKRVEIAGVLPWSLTESNISRLEIRKARMEDTLVFEARGGGSFLSARSGPDSKGVRVETEGGWSFESIR